MKDTEGKDIDNNSISGKCNDLDSVSSSSKSDVSSVLKDPNLLQKIIDEVHKIFYGEEDTILALANIISTRLVIGVNPESQNIVLSDLSGAGKDRLTKTICKTMLNPKTNYIHLRKITNEVPNYWHNKDKEWTWDGKVLHLEDITDDTLNCQALKMFASGESKGVTVIKNKAVEIKIKGKPVLIITTFTGSTENEQIRRFPFIHLNTSEELTEKVMTGVAELYSGNGMIHIDNRLRNALSNLQPVKVKIPFANELVKFFPKKLVSRTYFRRFLDYICSSTALFQYQREKDEDGFYIATWYDYDLARITLLKTISNASMIPLNREQEDLLKILLKHGKPMFVSDIRKEMAKNPDWLYRNLNYLKENNLIKQDEEFKPDANRTIATYSVLGGYYCGHSMLPTDRLSGFQAFLPSAILMNIDSARKRKGLEPIYEEYYMYNNKCNNTIIPKEKCNLKTTIKPPENQKWKPKRTKKGIIVEPEDFDKMLDWNGE